MNFIKINYQQEEFKKIEDTNYSVSNFGNVKNDKSGRILKKSINPNGYYIVNINKTMKIHRLVAKAFIPNPNNLTIIDHKNGLKTDNTKENLRWCSSSENNQNRNISNKNKSGFKGVCYDKRNNKWRSFIQIHNKKVHLGYFDKIEDAIKARLFKAKEIYREFMHESEKIHYDLIILREQKQKELNEIIELEKELFLIE